MVNVYWNLEANGTRGGERNSLGSAPSCTRSMCEPFHWQRPRSFFQTLFDQDNNGKQETSWELMSQGQPATWDWQDTYLFSLIKSNPSIMREREKNVSGVPKSNEAKWLNEFGWVGKHGAFSVVPYFGGGRQSFLSVPGPLKLLEQMIAQVSWCSWRVPRSALHDINECWVKGNVRSTLPLSPPALLIYLVTMYWNFLLMAFWQLMFLYLCLWRICLK